MWSFTFPISISIEKTLKDFHLSHYELINGFIASSGKMFAITSTRKGWGLGLFA